MSTKWWNADHFIFEEYKTAVSGLGIYRILFAAYTLGVVSTRSATQSPAAPTPADIAAATDIARQNMIDFLLWLPPAMGLMVSLVNFIATLVALEAVAILRKHYDNKRIYMAEDIPLPTLTSVSMGVRFQRGP